MEKELTFANNLVKGKIAETIFAQMFRRTNDFTVLEFGYEKVVPELVQNGYDEHSGIVETLRTAPDFAVIDQRHKFVKLIEVKFQHQLSEHYTLKAAKRMAESWNPSYLFIATLDGFFFDEINIIVRREGKIGPLSSEVIPQHIQDEYLEILCRYEQDRAE